MTIEQRSILENGGVDIDGALRRFGGDETVFITCLSVFCSDRSMADYRSFSEAGDWDNAGLAVHTLKGIAGNMGFCDLMHAASDTVALIREGRVNAAQENAAALNASYEAVAAVIREALAAGKRTDCAQTRT